MRLLRDRETRGVYTEELLESQLAACQMPDADRRLLQELVYGVVRWQGTLDWLIQRKTAGRAQKSALQILLRLGLYQLFWLDRIPAHAAVHETIEIAKQLGFGPQGGFLNAVLRGYDREKGPTRALLEELKRNEPWTGYSHPEWLWRRWEKRWGAVTANLLLAGNNKPAGTFARVNRLKTDTPALVEQWLREHVQALPFERDWIDAESVFELTSFPALSQLASFQQGLFYVQDPSTLLAVRELDPQPGDTVLDLCAAPGGKTALIAQLMRNSGRIVAQDLHFDRLRLIRENCERLGVTCVETSRADEVVFPELNIHFDRVLVDAPCSNTGVIRRRIDLRWRLRPEEIERLRQQQLELLRRASTILKPGGVLVYSTCSLEPEENEEVVKEFLAERNELVLESERTLLPFRDGVDGAYVARMRRRVS